MQDSHVSDSGDYESEGWPQSSSLPRNLNCIGEKANTGCSAIPSKSSKGMPTESDGTKLDELAIGEMAQTSKNLRESNHEPGMIQDHTPYFGSRANEPLGTPSGNNHQNHKSDSEEEDLAHYIDMRDDSVNKDISNLFANEIDSESHKSVFSVELGLTEEYHLPESEFESQRLTPESFGIQSHLLNTEDKDPDENESSDHESIEVDHNEALRARGIPETGVDDEDSFERDTNEATNNADDEVVEVDDENTKFAISETDEEDSCNQCNLIRAMVRKNMLAAGNGIAKSKIEEREIFGYIMCSQCEEREGNEATTEETSEVHR